MYDLGALIRSLRKERNITQKKLGEMLDVTEGTISKYEANTMTPPFETLRSIASIFNVSETPRNDLYSRTDRSTDRDSQSPGRCLSYQECSVRQAAHAGAVCGTGENNSRADKIKPKDSRRILRLVVSILNYIAICGIKNQKEVSLWIILSLRKGLKFL